MNNVYMRAFLSAALLFVCVFIFNNPVFSQDQQQLPTTTDIVRDSTMLIASAIDHHAVNNNCGYTNQLQNLVSDGYLKEYPVNAYTGKAMKAVDLGTNSPGEITYITIRDRKSSDIHGYILIVKGSEEDNDHSKTITYNGKKLFIKSCFKSGTLNSMINEGQSKHYLKDDFCIEDNGRKLDFTQEQFDTFIRIFDIDLS